MAGEVANMNLRNYRLWGDIMPTSILEIPVLSVERMTAYTIDFSA